MILKSIYIEPGVTPNEEGYIAIDITGEASLIEDGLAFIASLNVDINLTMNSLLWDQDRCVGCGNCVPHCPTGALHIGDKRSRVIDFHRDKCIECLNCIGNCPFWRLCLDILDAECVKNAQMGMCHDVKISIVVYILIH